MGDWGTSAEPLDSVVELKDVNEAAQLAGVYTHTPMQEGHVPMVLPSRRVHPPNLITSFSQIHSIHLLLTQAAVCPPPGSPVGWLGFPTHSGCCKTKGAVPIPCCTRAGRGGRRVPSERAVTHVLSFLSLKLEMGVNVQPLLAY